MSSTDRVDLTSTAGDRAMSGDGPATGAAFVRAFLAELDRDGVGYALLDDPTPAVPGLQVHLAVDEGGARRIERILTAHARRNAWSVVQSTRPTPTSIRLLAVRTDEPTDHVAIDATERHAVTRRPFNPPHLVAAMRERLGRSLRPPGLHLAVLGPDGAGKSTLLERLPDLLRPCFSRWTVLKFRPDVFGRIEPGVDPEPHAREPRSVLVSWAKIGYYVVDWWLGWLLVLRPARARNEWVVFDRNFDDMLVDQRRYMVQRSGWLVRLLRPLLPRPDAAFVLDVDPAAAHARKPELRREVLDAQRVAYRDLASRGPQYRLVAADAPPDQVARTVAREVVLLLERRRRPPVPLSKRAFDLALASLALVLLSPVLAATAGLVRVKLGTPVIFRQERPGLYGRPFTIYKFRTMTEARASTGRRLPDIERLTPFGRFLRSTSIDELPELVNVLKGEMSLVGPRPLLMEYASRYTPEQMHRHDVLPGITGWAQVHGRNEADWPTKFALDLWYVDNRSLWLDVRIVALTVLQVVRREGITPAGRVTVERFYGNQAASAATGEQAGR